MTRSARATVAIAAALVAVIGVVLGLLLVRDSKSDGPGPVAEGVSISPFTAPPGPISPVPAVRITVAGSSHLPPDSGITYGPENTIDDDRETAWNSDSREADGRGERLTYRFSEPIDLRVLRFVNGYTKNPEIFAANHRIRELLVTTDKSSQTVSLVDTAEDQQIRFDFGLTSKVVLEVVDIYQGDGFDDPELTSDLALTEVQFLAGQP